MSLAQSGSYVAFISFILGLLKVNIGNEEVSAFVEAVFVIVGLAMAWYGRYRKGDLTIIGARK